MSLTPSPAAVRPRRRSLLTGALGATGAALGLPLAAGCSGGESGGTADAERSDAARRLRGHTARDSEKLLARYDGTAQVHPALAARLRPLREEVARHARVLRGAETGTGSPSPSASGTPGGRSPSPATGGPRSRQPGPAASTPAGKPPRPDTASVPRDAKEALSALARAERRLAGDRNKALADAPPALARLLASIAASGAAHGYLLDELGKDPDGGQSGDGKGEHGEEAGGR
ncbi:hypothetical protein ACF1DY_16170 [Streptomyces albus]